ncbi:hypothetical protein FHX75_1350 [Micromonospora palomenae]|uniref:Uncharacterized protein n=1 Tax=Micromonospora palomenae TaxID=1461247 RepID=A0A561VN15_9ACTN|nr:hypothetical protein [Micromonospora palomenae]TWG13016.1 hypothetical protein FHX75_1350 [Micromonospora palomenae]
MGAKTGLLAFADGDVPTALRRGGTPDARRTAELVRRAHPGFDVSATDGSTLSDGSYPPDDVTYAASLPGVDLLCDRRFMVDRPSELSAHLLGLAAGRRVVLHAMHSVVDWLAFAVWEDGELVRSLSVSPGGGVGEDIGTPYAFELPYRAGEHPVRPVPGWTDDKPYPLPYHPLTLGEEALRHLFGFVVEGRRKPDDLDGDRIALLGFRVVDPTGREAAERAAMLELVRTMGSPRRFRYENGRMVEVVDR